MSEDESSYLYQDEADENSRCSTCGRHITASSVALSDEGAYPRAVQASLDHTDTTEISGAFPWLHDPDPPQRYPTDQHDEDDEATSSKSSEDFSRYISHAFGALSVPSRMSEGPQLLVVKLPLSVPPSSTFSFAVGNEYEDSSTASGMSTSSSEKRYTRAPGSRTRPQGRKERRKDKERLINPDSAADSRATALQELVPSGAFSSEPAIPRRAPTARVDVETMMSPPCKPNPPISPTLLSAQTKTDSLFGKSHVVEIVSVGTQTMEEEVKSTRRGDPKGMQTEPTVPLVARAEVQTEVDYLEQTLRERMLERTVLDLYHIQRRVSGWAAELLDSAQEESREALVALWHSEWDRLRGLEGAEREVRGLRQGVLHGRLRGMIERVHILEETARSDLEARRAQEHDELCLQCLRWVQQRVHAQDIAISSLKGKMHTLLHATVGTLSASPLRTTPMTTPEKGFKERRHESASSRESVEDIFHRVHQDCWRRTVADHAIEK